MIIKVITGSSFRNALAYGAGELNEKDKKKAEQCYFEWSSNVVSQDHEGIADEMNAVVRDSPTRVKNPVLHFVVSPEKGEKFDLRTVYNMLTDEFSIDRKNHQVAIYSHLDTETNHLHMYFNRVNMDSGKAIKLNHSKIRCVTLARKIEKELGIHQLTTPEVYKKKKENGVEVKPTAEKLKLSKGTIGKITKEILEVIEKERPTTVAELVKELAKVKIGFDTVSDKNGINGCKFITKKHGVRSGSTFGLKWKVLQKKLNENAQILQAPAPAPVLPQVVVPTLDKQTPPAPVQEVQALPKRGSIIKNEEDLLEFEAISKMLAMPSNELQELFEKRRNNELTKFEQKAVNKLIVYDPAIKKEFNSFVENERNKPTPAKSTPPAPTEVEIRDRLLKFYACVAFGGPQNEYHNSHIFGFVTQAKNVDDGLKMVAESLAKDFVNPVQAAEMFKKRILDDSVEQSQQGITTPYIFVREHVLNPSKKQFVDREKTADSVAWQTTVQQSNTFSQPKQELFEQLQQESLSYTGGLDLDLKKGRQLKH
jgi:hypothetical protein